MNEVASNTPLYIILTSMIASVLILFTRKNINLRETWTFIAAIIKFILVLSLYPAVSQGQVLTFEFFELLPDVYCRLRVDSLGLFFALVASSLWIITSIYSIGYMRGNKEKNQTRYFFSFALSLSAAMGIAFSGDLFTFFVFYEMLTLATYPLVAHKETPEAIKASRKYLVYSLTAGACLLFSMAWIYTKTGSLQFEAGGMLSGAFSGKALVALFLMMIYGCSVKAALFPVHAWLPSAMAAPTPVSALLHAVAVVKAGIFGVLRMIGFVFGPNLLNDSGLWKVVAFMAGFTILYASMIALAQDNLKRRLAYSTISQLSYIILGAALLSPTSYYGAMLHLSNHAMMKITLFFCAGAIYVQAHKENISEMRGLGRKMPFTFGAFAVGALGLSGLPPLCGLISKWYLVKGALEVHEWMAVFVFLSSALLNAAYLLPVVLTGFAKPNTQIEADEKRLALISPPVMTAILVILFGSIPFLIGLQAELPLITSNSVYGGMP